MRHHERSCRPCRRVVARGRAPRNRQFLRRLLLQALHERRAASQTAPANRDTARWRSPGRSCRLRRTGGPPPGPARRRNASGRKRPLCSFVFASATTCTYIPCSRAIANTCGSARRPSSGERSSQPPFGSMASTRSTLNPGRAHATNARASARGRQPQDPPARMRSPRSTETLSPTTQRVATDTQPARRTAWCSRRLLDVGTEPTPWAGSPGRSASSQRRSAGRKWRGRSATGTRMLNLVTRMAERWLRRGTSASAGLRLSPQRRQASDSDARTWMIYCGPSVVCNPPALIPRNHEAMPSSHVVVSRASAPCTGARLRGMCRSGSSWSSLPCCGSSISTRRCWMRTDGDRWTRRSWPGRSTKPASTRSSRKRTGAERTATSRASSRCCRRIVAVLYSAFGPERDVGAARRGGVLGRDGGAHVPARAHAAGAAAGLAAAMLVAVSPSAVFYGRAFMPDTLMVFFSLAALIGFIRHGDSGRVRALVAGSLSLGLADPRQAAGGPGTGTDCRGRVAQ